MSAPLWTADEAARATGGRAVGAWEARGVSIDTRSLEEGDLFVALSGARDGHDFVVEAFAKGAAAALVARDMDGAPARLVVDDPLRALAALGARARARSGARVVAVTGSVGKTGTKELLRAALGEGTHASAASHNNHIGVPLSLARLPAGAPAGVFEIGMNRPGEIGPLARLVAPDAAVVTRIAPAHLEHLGGVDEVAEEKAHVFDGLSAGGVALVPRDSPGAGRLEAAARAAGAGRIIGFGAGEDADARLLAADVTCAGTAGECALLGRRIRFRLRLAGRHWAQNALAAGACAAALGVPPGEAFRRMAGVRPFEGRGRCLTVPAGGGEAVVVDDSYNASPASVRAALETLAQAPVEGRRIAVLGDMRELGRCSAALHAGLADAAAGIDLVWCVGPEMEALFERLPEGAGRRRAGDGAAAADALAGEVAPGDVVLVKGSRATALEAVVRRLAGAAEG